MKKTFVMCMSMLGAVVMASEKRMPIDRHALVTRHTIELNDVKNRLALGNGEFCFGADGTGLQTFSGNSMAHWAWHSFPLPKGFTKEMIPATGSFHKGRLTAGEVINMKAEPIPWMRNNPQNFNLGRLSLCRANGGAIKPTDISGLTRKLDLWTGVQTSSYTIDGSAVRVETCVHPTLDRVAVKIESSLLEKGGLEVAVAFPYPTLRKEPWLGDFTKAPGDNNIMEISGKTERRADFKRVLDETVYHAALDWSEGGRLVDESASNACRIVSSGSGKLEILLTFSEAPVKGALATFADTRDATAKKWESFWKSGGAIDLSESKDPRWKELERRIVLSQYQMAAQSAGSLPPAEIGLMTLDQWTSRMQMEMIWWHCAHYALWDRWDMTDKALGCYKRFTPVARELAQQLGYKGLKWGKSVGPDGRTGPWTGSHVLLWKQPHPIFFAELEYRLKPTRATLEKWADVVQGTADHMADYPKKDEATGVYSLDPSMPPSEQGVTKDTVFELAYWRWGLDKAQEWRERMGLKREAQWDEVRRHLAPLSVVDGLFVHSSVWHDTYTKRAWEHPDPVGVLGMLPPIDGVDATIAKNTVAKVWVTWNWNRVWGWDFPWMAMAAARTGQPEIAVDALLKECKLNSYPANGINGGWYLPGNGGVLYAVAMMAAGWDGAPNRNAPGFPDDGSWVVKWEGLKKAP
jgi:hypothetical protein